MAAALFDYPKNAVFGRVLPKSKIYEHGRPSTAVKELFIRQVAQISWQYKLAPETINIKGTRTVPEIQIFSITLKDGEVKPDVLRCIDQAIPFPILFELRFDNKVCPIAAYKRPSDADAGKWVVSDYFSLDWMPEKTPRKALPMVFDLAILYRELLTPLLPHPALEDEGLQEHVERMELIRLKQRELERCDTRLRKERQFNRKVAINAEVRALKQELEKLTRPLPEGNSAVVPRG